MSTKYSIGQMNQLADALEAANFSPDEVTKLRSYAKLADIKVVLAGNAEILISKHVIDCDAYPFVPKGWKVEEHQNGGEFRWNLDEVELYLCDEQKDSYIVGNKLLKKLRGKPVLNANVLDYLLANPNLIPEEWKGKDTCFWGTIYRYSNVLLCVRYLCWNSTQWDWHYKLLDYGFRDNNPAALLSK